MIISRHSTSVWFRHIHTDIIYSTSSGWVQVLHGIRTRIRRRSLGPGMQPVMTQSLGLVSKQEVLGSGVWDLCRCHPRWQEADVNRVRSSMNNNNKDVTKFSSASNKYSKIRMDRGEIQWSSQLWSMLFKLEGKGQEQGRECIFNWCWRIWRKPRSESWVAVMFGFNQNPRLRI